MSMLKRSTSFVHEDLPIELPPPTPKEFAIPEDIVDAFRRNTTSLEQKILELEETLRGMF